MQQGGSLYGAPPPPPEAVPPISSRAPPPPQLNFDELATTVSGPSFPEDAGGPATPSGNRWPRHETLALIRIRSDMDATFREATLKGPLWEEVSRKLGEQGITRSAKKCKEKFENVHKYYKRTKEGRAGRQDGKSYRFFSELEALHGTVPGAASVQPLQPAPIASAAPPPAPPANFAAVGLGFSSGSESGSGSDDGTSAARKRRRRGGGRRTMEMFGEMMRKVLEQQEGMQRRLLDAIERREQDRVVREEAWRRQEASRLCREHELAAQERSMAASRDAAIIAFLHKISDDGTVAAPAPPVRANCSKQVENARPEKLQPEEERGEDMDTPSPSPPSPLPRAPMQQQPATAAAEAAAGDPASSRWPKTEVLALIELRTALDVRYQDSGPKGPLWEEISSGMQRLGYARNAKRCKEKWENINKYFKKVKESNKKRPEDAKTCPYFHQLEAIYHRRSLGQLNRNGPRPDPSTAISPSHDGKPNGGIIAAIAAPEEAAAAMSERMKEMLRSGMLGKPSDVQDSASISAHDDKDYNDEDDDNENDEHEKMAYKIEFQRPGMVGAAKNTSVGPTMPAAMVQ